MSARMPSHPARGAAQRGFILVTGLLFLVVITLVAVAMFRSTGLMDRIAANARDKQRSFEAAQSALQYAEWWLSTNKPGSTSSACNSLGSGDTAANVHVCSNAIQSDFLTATAWTRGFSYTPPNLTSLGGTGAGGGLVNASGTGGDVNYYNLPGFYLTWLAFSSSKGGNIYQVTAYGYGGNTTTMTVLRSTYLVPTTTPSGGGGGGLTGP
jgi:type IV pilus assembly protein PilX